MSKERELLERWVSQFGNLRHDFNLLTETKELLAQPEQEPLSKDAIRAIVNQLPTEVDLDTGIEFCRIIEKAHGIGVGNE